MRIAYVITRADEIGGAQVHVRDLATAMHHAGHEVTVMAGCPGILSAQLSERGVPFKSVPALVREIRPWRELEAFLRLKALLARLRPDLVSTHSSKAGWLGRLAARMLGIPALFTAHGWAFTEGVPEPERGVYAFAERLAAPLAERIITVSEYDRSLALERRISQPEKIVRIHNGVHEIPGLKARSIEDAGPRILMTGRFSRQKDHSTLLRALAGLRDIQWHLELAGDGPGQAQVRTLAHRFGIAERVHVLGMRLDVPVLLARADIYTLISNWEGLPYGVLEAMSVGLPVVASDVGGVSEAVSDGRTGFLIRRGDVEALSARFRTLLLNAELRRGLGAAGRRRFCEEFCFDIMFNRTLTLYDEACLTERRPISTASARAQYRR
jgi:glycosyltransferase involved in cell wall biosynthesis